PGSFRSAGSWSLPGLAHEEPHEVEAAEAHGHDAHGELGGRERALRDEVARGEQHGSHDGGGEEAHARRAREAARELRRGERDERDGSGRGRGEGRERDADDDEREPHPFGAQAEGGRGVVPELEQPHARREPREREHEEDGEHARGRRLRPRRAVERPGAPHRGRHRGLEVGCDDEPLVDGREHRGHGDAHDDEAEPLDPAPVREQVHGGGGEDAPDERARRDARVPAADHEDHDERARVGAGAEPDDVGAAERVAGDRLEDRAARAERRAEHESEEGARQAPLHDDEAHRSVHGAHERVEHLRHAERVVARRQRDDAEREPDERERRAHRERPHVEPEAHAPAERPDDARGAAEAAAVPSAVGHARARGHRVPDGRAHSPLAEERRTSATSTGAPTNAVTMPTCSSPGETTTRPTTSDTSSRTGASTAAYGRIQRWSGPTAHRATCGTMRPTNAIGPAAAVAAPHRSITATPTSTRVRPTWAPGERARSSPSATLLRGRATTTASTSPARTNGAIVAAVSAVRPASEPAVQKRRRSNAAGS